MSSRTKEELENLIEETIDIYPEKTKKDIKFVFTNRLEDVLKTAMQKWPPKKINKTRKIMTTPSYIAAN